MNTEEEETKIININPDKTEWFEVEGITSLVFLPTYLQDTPKDSPEQPEDSTEHPA